MTGAADSCKSVNELNRDLYAPEKDDRFHSPVEARKKAKDYLARREYGQKELIRKLATAGFDSSIASRAVAQLTDDGLQDDCRFVENFIQSRINQGKGPVRIHADLGQRGLAGGLVDEVLEEVSVDWYSLARDARYKKFGDLLPADFKEKARQMRFLQQRGFEQDQIDTAVSESSSKL